MPEVGKFDMRFYIPSERTRSPHFNCANDKSVSRSIPDIREELEQAFVISQLQKNAFSHISFDRVRSLHNLLRYT